jgi:predicted XRE-type DNA-binding protein
MLRDQLRECILERITQLQLTHGEAAELLGLSAAQISRLVHGQDIFTLDRLVDVATQMGLSVRMTVTRPYQSR